MADMELKVPEVAGHMDYFEKDSFSIDVKCKRCFTISNVPERHIGMLIKLGSCYRDDIRFDRILYSTRCSHTRCGEKVDIDVECIPGVVIDRLHSTSESISMTSTCSCDIEHTPHNTNISQLYEANCWHCLQYCIDTDHHIVECLTCNNRKPVVGLDDKLADTFRHTNVS